MTVAKAKAGEAASKGNRKATPVRKGAVAKSARVATAAPVARSAGGAATGVRGGVTVRSQGGPHAVRSARVRAMAARMLRELGRTGAELSVMLVDDDGIRELNRSWRSIDRATDVLSFPMLEGDFGTVNPSMLGDIVISIPTASKQARAAGRTLEQEVAMLLAHGLLHLLGYDHDTRAKEKLMQGETDRLTAAVAAAT